MMLKKTLKEKIEDKEKQYEKLLDLFNGRMIKLEGDDKKLAMILSVCLDETIIDKNRTDSELLLFFAVGFAKILKETQNIEQLITVLSNYYYNLKVLRRVNEQRRGLGGYGG